MPKSEYLIRLRFISIIFFFVYVNNCFAQFDEDIESDILPSTQNLKKDSTESVFFLKSSYFTLENFLDTISYGDSTLTDNFPYFDPVDSSFTPMISNGNIGAASMQITGMDRTEGLDPGIHIYDIYNKNFRNFQWHTSKYPFTQIYGSPSHTYENFIVGAKFYRNFRDLNLGIDYNRINNKGDYSNQDTKHTHLNLGIWKGNINSKWNTFFNFLVNVHEENQNGGLKFIDPTTERISNPTILSNAKIRTDNYGFSLNEFYRLKDSTYILGFRPFLKGELGYSKGFFKFFDDDVTTNSNYYKILMTDADGLRNYFEFGSLFSSMGIYGISKNKSNILLEAKYKRDEYKIESMDNKISNLIIINLHSKLILNQKLNSEISTELFLKNVKPEYRLNAELNIDLKYAKLNAGIESKSTNPSLLEQTLVISQKLVYQNDFKNILKQSMHANLEIPYTRTSIFAKLQNINNHIYIDTSLLPIQLNKNIQILEGNIEQKLKFSIVNFDNTIFYFRASSEAIPLPKFIIRSKLYIHATLFNKVLDLYTGFEYNYWGQYYNYGFNPAIANFYIQKDQKLENFQRLDYYLSGKIGDFRIFFRMNNILFPIDDKIFYQVTDYPKYDLFYRFGIKWTLMD